MQEMLYPTAFLKGAGPGQGVRAGHRRPVLRRVERASRSGTSPPRPRPAASIGLVEDGDVIADRRRRPAHRARRRRRGAGRAPREDGGLASGRGSRATATGRSPPPCAPTPPWPPGRRGAVRRVRCTVAPGSWSSPRATARVGVRPGRRARGARAAAADVRGDSRSARTTAGGRRAAAGATTSTATRSARTQPASRASVSTTGPRAALTSERPVGHRGEERGVHQPAGSSVSGTRSTRRRAREQIGQLEGRARPRRARARRG